MSWAEITRLDPPRVESLPDDDSRIIFMYGFRFSFHPIIIDSLKRQIHWHQRSWDAEEKRWYVTGECLETLKRLALTFHEATLIEGNVTLDLHTGRVIEQLDLWGT